MVTDDRDTAEGCPDDETNCYCRTTGLVGLLGRKYAMQVVCAIGAHETLRFGDLEAHLPDASTSTLSDRLDELEGAGLVTRTRYDEIPPRVEYELTREGRGLQRRLKPLLRWLHRRE